VRAHGRPWTHIAAVACNNANYVNTAWYCAILRAVAAKITQHQAKSSRARFVREGTCVHVLGCNNNVSAVIEINVFDYARARAQCE